MKVVDMHCDTILELYKARERGEEISLLDNDLHIDLKKMEAGDYFLQNFALFVDLKGTEDPFLTCVRMADLFYQVMEENWDRISPVTTWAEIERNWKEGRMSALLTLEEGEVCQGDPALLRTLYRLGARMMTFTWNYENSLAWPGREGGLPETEKGLKERGFEILEEMEALGMIVDVAHLSDAGIWDVLRTAKKPFVASHSNARSLASHARNLTDEMIRGIAQKGGVIGMNFAPAFLRDEKDWGSPKAVSVEDVVRHIRHMIQVGGMECVGLGSDLDGCKISFEIESAADMPLLINCLEKNGFTASQIDKICFENVLRLYKEVL